MCKQRIDRHEAGLLPDFGGDVGAWQDTIRFELERAHAFYAEQMESLKTERDEIENDTWDEVVKACGGGDWNESPLELIVAMRDEIYRLESKSERLERNVKYRDDIIGLSPQGDRHAHLAAEIKRLRDHFETFAGFVATTRRENTYEWMCLLLDWLNGACTRLDPEAWFDLIGADHFVLRHKREKGNR